MSNSFERYCNIKKAIMQDAVTINGDQYKFIISGDNNDEVIFSPVDLPKESNDREFKELVSNKYSGEFSINASALDDNSKKQFNFAVDLILSNADSYAAIQEQVNKLNEKLYYQRIELQKAKNKLVNLVEDLRHTHRGYTLREDDIAVGDIFLTYDVRCRYAYNNMLDSIFVWVVSSITDNKIYANRLDVFRDKKDFRLNFNYSTEDGFYFKDNFIECINGTNASFKITSEEYNKFINMLLGHSGSTDNAKPALEKTDSFLEELEKKYKC